MKKYEIYDEEEAMYQLSKKDYRSGLVFIIVGVSIFILCLAAWGGSI